MSLNDEAWCDFVNILSIHGSLTQWHFQPASSKFLKKKNEGRTREERRKDEGRKNEGRTKEERRKNEGRTREERGKNEGRAREERGKNEGRTREERGKNKVSEILRHKR
jgi:hypothetical protein